MIRLFDLGMGEGNTTDLFIDKFAKLGADYVIYGFEPQKKVCDFLVEKYLKNANIHIINAAVSDFEGKAKLYNSTAKNGNSICEAKHNVTKEFEECDVIVFSRWFNRLDMMSNDINVVICDIEGSEYEFYKDIVESGVAKKIALYCGSLGDIHKLNKPVPEVALFLKYLGDNDILVNELSITKTNNLSTIIDRIRKAHTVASKIPATPVLEEVVVEKETGSWFNEPIDEVMHKEFETTLDEEIVKSVKKKRIKSKKGKKDVDKN